MLTLLATSLMTATRTHSWTDTEAKPPLARRPSTRHRLAFWRWL